METTLVRSFVRSVSVLSFLGAGLAVQACSSSPPAVSPQPGGAPAAASGDATPSGSSAPVYSHPEQPQAAGGGAERRASPTAQALVKFVKDTPKKVVIAPRDGKAGLGDHQVSVDGKPVWPPTGARCAELAACCDDAAKADRGLALACQFAVVRDATCEQGLATIKAVLTEQGAPVPATCGR